MVSISSSPNTVQIIDAGVHSDEWISCSLHPAGSLPGVAATEVISAPEHCQQMLLQWRRMLQSTKHSVEL